MKILKKDFIKKNKQIVHTKVERKILEKIDYPFIAQLFYAFQNKEKLYMITEYMPGGEMFYHLHKEEYFKESKAKFYICEIILALGELHKNNIIFRDLKPDNVVIDKEGHALLTDFGLSREGVVGKEIAKSFCGSIAYLAPEMLNRCGHGKAVDWYLLGVLFYELLVGVPPYFTANQEQIFKNIQRAELYIPPFVSDKAQNLIRSLLKRNPNERLGSKRDMEEIKEDEYFSDVDWQKVYERKYKPPQIYLKSNHLQFFRQPVQFKENEEDDLFVKDSNVDYNKYNQDILYNMNNYEGWSFVQKNNDDNNAK
jgi:serine/threonine protein kinase